MSRQTAVEFDRLRAADERRDFQLYHEVQECIADKVCHGTITGRLARECYQVGERKLQKEELLINSITGRLRRYLAKV